MKLFPDRWRRRSPAIAITPNGDTQCFVCRQTISPGDAVVYRVMDFGLFAEAKLIHVEKALCIARLLQKLGEKESADKLATEAFKAQGS